jgi:hypothetical protein
VLCKVGHEIFRLGINFCWVLKAKGILRFYAGCKACVTKQASHPKVPNGFAFFNLNDDIRCLETRFTFGQKMDIFQDDIIYI